MALPPSSEWRPAKTRRAQHLPDGRGGQAELAGDDQWACLRIFTRSEDPLLELTGAAPRLPPRRRPTIRKSRPTALLIPAPKPVTRRTTRAAGHRSRLRTHPSTINETSRQRDSNEKRIRFGGQTRSCIWASCASWVLVDHKARRRPGRNQPSRRCVGNRTRPASPSSSHGTRQRRGPSVARRTSRRSPCRM